MKNRLEKGFTLIELLVVIAIIGILSSVVLASLNTARGKGSNAAVKANLTGMRAAAELYYDGAGAGDYIGFCATQTAALAAAASAGGGTAATATNDCNETVAGDAWAAYSVLKVSETVGATTYTTWCVDSTGASKGQTSGNVTSLGTTGTACL
ncbi:MAG: Type IV pilin PilA [Parcubacteria bacterium C7867-006]|nr:MAG: Type IV pilin PilA [Parcubacteria bacterium C7867-006]